MQKQCIMTKTLRLACCFCLAMWCCLFLSLTSQAGVAHEETSHVNNKASNTAGNGASMQAEAEMPDMSSPSEKSIASEAGPANAIPANAMPASVALNTVTPARVIPDSEAPDKVVYESMVVAKKGSEMLALYNTLSDPVDKESLDNLARDCFQQVHGSLYKKVLVNWYLPGQSKGDKPWAVSNFADGKEVIEILDEEMVKKFPSVKRWQQPGHDPLPR